MNRLVEWWSDLPLRVKGLIVVVAPAAATVLIAAAALFLAMRTVDQEEWVRHTFLVTREIQRLIAKEAELSSEVRGYFITSDSAFEGRVRDTIVSFGATQNIIDRLISDNPAQTRRMSEIATLQLSRVQRISADIARFESGAMSGEGLRAALRAADVERLNMKIVLTTMEKEEMRLLETRSARVQSLRTERAAAIVICAFLGIFGGAVKSLLLAGGITKRIGKLQEDVSRLAAGGVCEPLPGGKDEIWLLSVGIANSSKILKQRAAALENALHGIAQADADGRWLTFNRKFAELAGLKESQRVASITENVHPDDRAKVEEALRLMSASGRAETEARLMHAGGETADMIMTFITVPEDAGAGYYIFLRDNRERKEVEATLVTAKDAAVASNAAKTWFLAKISHDIRTPLNAILGAADLLSHTRLNTDQSEYVSIFQRNCKRLVILINDFLDFSRIEAGALQLQKQPARIREIVHDAVATFREPAGLKNIQVGVEIDPGIPEWVVVDPSRVQQVLVNLLSNAVKFTVQGRVDVRVRRIGRNREQIRFEIRDTGPGIDPTDQKRVFEPFTQLPDQTISERGCGLGLTICSELVGLMGGEMGLLSRRGLGSTFHFDLLLESPRSTDPVPYATASESCTDWCLSEPVRILVAEDTADNRLLLEHYLRGKPVEIRFAMDGQEAVEISQRHEFDLILMDIDMPGIDGYAATRLIRASQAECGGKTTPIVALSAHAMREAVQASLDAGCVAHIAKPLDCSTLIRTIRRYAVANGNRTACSTPSCLPPEGVASLVPIYLGSKPRQIEEARACLEAEDFETIQRFGHNLKGTGTGYGFPRIAELGREIESAASARDGESIAMQLDALHRFITRDTDGVGSEESVPTQSI